MNQIKFSCKATNHSDVSDLGLEVWIDNNKFFDNTISQGNHNILCNFNEDENDHVLKFIFKNKTTDHTVISESGQILTDAYLQISEISFDEIQIDQMVFDNAIYTHDYNGTGKMIEENFFGTLGCNGKVELNFSTPFYIWLLEHM